MRIRERRTGNVTVVDLSGKFTVVSGLGRVKDAVTSLVFDGRKHIVLNLADVNYVDSSGLGELVACYVTAERFGSSIKLANADGHVRDMVVLNRLLALFESHDSEAAAIKSFAEVAA